MNHQALYSAGSSEKLTRSPFSFQESIAIDTNTQPEDKASDQLIKYHRPSLKLGILRIILKLSNIRFGTSDRMIRAKLPVSFCLFYLHETRPE